jgi:hypothetical protein
LPCPGSRALAARIAPAIRRHGAGILRDLVAERGLQLASVVAYRHYLRHFQAHLQRTGVGLADLSPVILAAFVADRSRAGPAKTTARQGCSVLREVVRHARRESLTWRDLASAVEWQQVYRRADILRSISWEEMGRVLEAVDTRTLCGKRDHAILLLLVTYRLRGREVAAPILDDIDWKRSGLRSPSASPWHSMVFSLSAPVGRRSPVTCVTAGPRPPAAASSSQRWRSCGRSGQRHLGLRAAVPAGRWDRGPTPWLANAEGTPSGGASPTLYFSLNAIGDFLAHHSPASNEIYTKIAVASLRQVALGDVEEAPRRARVSILPPGVSSAKTSARPQVPREERELRLLGSSRPPGAGRLDQLIPGAA